MTENRKSSFRNAFLSLDFDIYITSTRFSFVTEIPHISEYNPSLATLFATEFILCGIFSR